MPSAKVAELRTIFFWPLTLEFSTEADAKPGGFRPPIDRGNDCLLQQYRALIAEGGPWMPVEDGLNHLPPPGLRDPGDDPTVANAFNRFAADAYGEFTYFHDFVQRTLFGKTTPDARGPILLLQRRDIAAVDVQFWDWGKAVTFHVERVNLYLLRPGSAVLTLQCAHKSDADLDLAMVQRFNDGMRRSHRPFFEVRKGRVEPRGNLPDKVIWKTFDAKGNLVPHAFDLTRLQADPDDGALPDAKRALPPYLRLLETPPEERRVPPVPHWRWLLNGGCDGGSRMPLGPGPGRDYHWRHFSDDRLAIQSTIILDSRRDYYALSDGQWMRLAFVDAPGSDPFPYDEAFLRSTFEQHCYDRYHHPKTAVADAPTRYLICDYAMTAVSYREGNSYASVLAMHMQRHYYQLFLLQVIDKSVMLGLSSRISSAVRNYNDRLDRQIGPAKAEALLSSNLQDIERDFLQYVHLFRFTGVSGQLQAGELHAQLRKTMKLDEMFDDIKVELETAVAFLTAREAQHATDAAERLNIVVALGAVVGLVLTFFSMNLLTTEAALYRAWARLTGTVEPTPWWQRLLPAQPPPHAEQLGWQILALGAGTVLACALALGLLAAIAHVTRHQPRHPRPSERLIALALRGGLLVGAGLAAAGFFLR